MLPKYFRCSLSGLALATTCSSISLPCWWRGCRWSSRRHGLTSTGGCGEGRARPQRSMRFPGIKCKPITYIVCMAGDGRGAEQLAAPAWLACMLRDPQSATADPTRLRLNLPHKCRWDAAGLKSGCKFRHIYHMSPPCSPLARAGTAQQGGRPHSASGAQVSPGVSDAPPAGCNKHLE